MQVTNVKQDQYNALNDISEMTDPLTENDYKAFQEIQGVLKKYGVTKKFGINLLHRHFDLHSNDERLVEFTDKENRELTTKVINKDYLNQRKITPTQWMFTEDGEKIVCACNCFYTDEWGHGHSSPA